MAQNMAQHFTFAKLLRFTLPSVGMMVFMSLYVMIDGFFVSNWCGATALAAVNFAYPIPAILGSLGFMLGTGGNAIVASIAWNAPCRCNADIASMYAPASGPST